MRVYKIFEHDRAGRITQWLQGSGFWSQGEPNMATTAKFYTETAAKEAVLCCTHRPGYGQGWACFEEGI